MNADKFGLLIQKLRVEQNISLENLSKGLCSFSFLGKIEKGKVIPKFFLTDLLLQRLGKSSDKFEIIMSNEEYQQLEERDEIAEEMLKGEYSLAHSKLEQYHRKYGGKEKIQKIYYYRSLAFLAYEEGQQSRTVRNHMNMALKLLGMENPESSKLSVLSSMELENIMLMGKLLFEEPAYDKALEILEPLYLYIQKIDDEEKKVKAIPKCACLLGDIYLKQGQELKAMKIWEESLYYLRCSANTYFMIPLMKRLLAVYECGNEEKKKEILIKQMEALSSLYEENNLNYMKKECLFFQSYQKEIYVDYEIIREERLAQGLTQEAVIEGNYCSVETLSRIENGKCTPRIQWLSEIFKKLGIAKQKYNPCAEVDEFQLLEIHHELRKLDSYKDYEGFEKKLGEFAADLNLEQGENRLFIEILKNLSDFRREEKEEEEVLAKAIELLKRYDIKGESNRTPMENEIKLICTIMAVYRNQKRYQEAITILEKLFRVYKKSKVQEKYHFRSYAVLLEVYAAHLKEHQVLESASAICGQGIHFLLSCGKGCGLGLFLANKAYAMEPKKDSKAICGELFKKAFYLLDLFMLDRDREAIEKHYHQNYDAAETWY